MFDENQTKEADEKLGYTNNGVTDQWLKTLTNGERGSLNEYTGDYYSILNKHMRYDEVDDYDKKNIKNIENAIEKFELKQDTVFSRGSGPELLGGASTVEEIQAMVGQAVVDKAFMSSASAGEGFYDDITYHILTHPGKGIGAYIKPVSDLEHENEFLFNRNSIFEIKGAYKDSNGQVHCNLEYAGRA